MHAMCVSPVQTAEKHQVAKRKNVMLFILVHGKFLLSTNLQKDNALRTGHTLNISQSDMSANFSSIASNDGDEERSLNRKLEALEFKLRKVKRERDEMAEQTQMLEKN